MISETCFSPLSSRTWHFSHRRLNKTPQPLHRELIVVSTHHNCNSTSDETGEKLCKLLDQSVCRRWVPEAGKGLSLDCMVPAPIFELLEPNPSANVVLVSKAALAWPTRILQCCCLGTAPQYWIFGTGWCIATFSPLSLCRVKTSQTVLGGGLLLSCWITFLWEGIVRPQLDLEKKNVCCK